MRTARHIILALLLAMPICAVSSKAGGAAPKPATAEEARTVLRDAVRRLDIQTEIPEEKAKPAKKEYESDRSSPFALSAETAKIILWAAAIVALVVILLTLRDNLWSANRRRAVRGAREETAPEAVAARMDQAQDDADELARQGGFAEAMHLLLLQSVGELRRRLGISIAASLTSREILHRVGLAPEGRAAFADIIGRVEISYFGAHLPGKDEYLACRRSFETLTETLRHGGSA